MYLQSASSDCQACVNAGLFAMFFFGAFYYDVYFRFFRRKARRQ